MLATGFQTETIFVSKNKYELVEKNQRGRFCNGCNSTANLTCSIYKTDTAVEKLCEEAHKHTAFIHF